MELITGWRKGICVMWPDISLLPWLVRYDLSLSFVITIFIIKITTIVVIFIMHHSDDDDDEKEFRKWMTIITDQWSAL